MDIASLINSIGYPAAITLGMAYFLKYVFDKNTKLTEEILEVIEHNTEALSEMKNVSRETLERLKGEGKENEKDSD